MTTNALYKLAVIRLTEGMSVLECTHETASFFDICISAFVVQQFKPELVDPLVLCA